MLMSWIYCFSGLTIQANMYYKMLINWTSQKIKDTYATRNAFDFKNGTFMNILGLTFRRKKNSSIIIFHLLLLCLYFAVRNFDRSLINAPGPCILFATPGMIVGGFSLEVFMQWAPSELNLVTLPGYEPCYILSSIYHKWLPVQMHL